MRLEVCQTMSEPASSSPVNAGPETEPAEAELARYFSLGRAAAQKLVRAGHFSVESVRNLSDEQLSRTGLEPNDVERIRAARTTPTDGTGQTTPVDGRRVMEKWLESVKKAERPRRRSVSASPKDSTVVLRKWVEGDDAVLEAWIRQSEPAPARPRITAPAPATPPVPGVETPPPAEGAVGLPSNLVEREETVVHWLTDLLDRVKSDRFDPVQVLQEGQELQRQLYDERQRRKQREEELEHVKRGSIAVIKYVRNREAKERDEMLQSKEAEIADLKLKLFESQSHPSGTSGSDGPASSTVLPGPNPPGVPESQVREMEAKIRAEFTDREHSFIERETELRRRIIQLEGDARNLRAQAETADRRGRLVQLDSASMSREVNDRLSQADAREREIVIRENELRTKFEEIRIRAEEFERKREPVLFKEKELQSWEQELRVRQQALEVEGRRIEQARLTSANPETADAVKRLRELQAEVAKKEDELRTREQFLHQKMEELEGLERRAAEGEAERLHTDIVSAASAGAAKLSSGVRRLDDLLFGGLPTGAQVLINGPAHTGKDVLARLFIAEGLKRNVPAIWVVTDKTYRTIREDMMTILPAYADFESKGMVKYVDLYAKSLGVNEAERSVTLLRATDKGVLEQLIEAVAHATQDLRSRAESYRLVFESVSTLTAYHDTATTYRFLQPFTGRCKLDGALGYYVLETGMHSESDLQTLEHMVDGSLNLKIDQLKTYLSVRGITDVQSRAWVGYNFTKKSFTLGSFSLDHIR